MPDSGVPNVGEPDCMSMLDRNEPKITGQPGRISWASAMPDSASAICCTSAAGIVTGDIAPIRMNGVSTHGLAGRGVLELRLEHPVVPAQRRVAVDQRDRRPASARSASRPPNRISLIAMVSRGVDAGDHVAHVDLVGQRLQRVDHVEVPRVERRVVRLADHAAGRVEHRVATGPAWRSCGSRPWSRRGARRPRARTAGRRPRRTPSSRRRCARCCAGLRACTSNSRGRLRHLLEHELRVEEDRVVLDPLAGLAEQLERRSAVELDADLGDQPAPAGVEHGHRVLGEDLVARHRVAEHPTSSPCGLVRLDEPATSIRTCTGA